MVLDDFEGIFGRFGMFSGGLGPNEACERCTTWVFGTPEAGAAVNGGRLSPLQIVAMHGHFEAAQLLLEAKAAPGCVAGALKLEG